MDKMFCNYKDKWNSHVSVHFNINDISAAFFALEKHILCIQSLLCVAEIIAVVFSTTVPKHLLTFIYLCFYK